MKQIGELIVMEVFFTLDKPYPEDRLIELFRGNAEAFDEVASADRFVSFMGVGPG